MSTDDLQMMDFGQALDIIAEYVDQHTEKKETEKTVSASQSDFNAF